MLSFRDHAASMEARTRVLTVLHRVETTDAMSTSTTGASRREMGTYVVWQNTFKFRNEEGNAYRKSPSLRLPKSRESSRFAVCGLA
jgi:hypothetical protein